LKLDQQTLVQAALSLVDEMGLDHLNMRSLAKRLNVQASALYWHVANKEELLGLMAGDFYRMAYQGVAPSSSWREWLIAFGRAFRTALQSHNDSARLCALARPFDEQIQQAAERLARPLMDLGLSMHDALAYQASVLSLTLGWTVYEQSNSLHDHLAEMVGFDHGYTIGLQSLVAGFPERISV